MSLYKLITQSGTSVSISKKGKPYGTFYGASKGGKKYQVLIFDDLVLERAKNSLTRANLEITVDAYKDEKGKDTDVHTLFINSFTVDAKAKARSLNLDKQSIVNANDLDTNDDEVVIVRDGVNQVVKKDRCVLVEGVEKWVDEIDYLMDFYTPKNVTDYLRKQGGLNGYRASIDKLLLTASKRADLAIIHGNGTIYNKGERDER